MIAIFNRAKALKGLLVAGFIAVSLWAMTAPAYAIDMYDNERGQKQTTERYDKIQSEQGGMNNFDDVDPRRNANEAKAQTLIDTAKRRKAQASDPLETAREAIGDLKNNITGAADDAASTITNKADQLTDKAASAVDSVGNKAADAADRVGNKAANAADRAGSKADNLTDRAANAADRAGSKADRLTDKAANAADRAGDKVDRAAKSLTNRPADAAGRGGSIKPGRGDYQLND